MIAGDSLNNIVSELAQIKANFKYSLCIIIIINSNIIK